MNIFVVNEDPIIAAKELCDKHIVKMPLETAQMLCYVSYINNGNKRLNEPYGPCKPHLKHPCTLWANEDLNNWEWLYLHGIELCNEYTRRYKRKHKSMDVIIWAKENGNKPKNNVKLRTFVQCMPEAYKSSNPIEGYRNFYIKDKSSFAIWKYTDIPKWYLDGLKNENK